MVLELSEANVKGLVVNEEADEFAIGTIDDRLSRFGIGVSSLGIGHRTQLVEGVQVGAWLTMWLPLIEVASQSDVSVGEGKNGLGLSQGVQVKSHLADAPLFEHEGRKVAHRQAPSSMLSETTKSAIRQR